jgi:uncharacterized protein (DUF2252 family)
MAAKIPLRIKRFNTGREAQVLHLKYNAMAENAFRFLRGTAHLFYEDLLRRYPLPASPAAWICGDLHTENFGSYKDANGRVHFDMNDFDEAVKTPLLYELCRLLVSVHLAAKETQFSKKETQRLIERLLRAYRQTLITGNPLPPQSKTEPGLIKKLITQVRKRKEKELIVQRTSDSRANAQLLVSDRLRPLDEAGKQGLITAFEKWGKKNHYGDYRVTDAGFRIAGTGSIGITRYCCLLENRNNPRHKKLIDIKLAMPPSILKYAKPPQPQWKNDAERITKVQQMMQHTAPAGLSCFRYFNEWYVVKEMQPSADKVDMTAAVKQPKIIAQYITGLGVLTATAQLRSSGKYGSATADELRCFAKEESWLPALTEWAAQYAQQVKKDYKAFYAAWKAGYFGA